MKRRDSIQIGDLKALVMLSQGLALCGIAEVMGVKHTTVLSKMRKIGEVLGEPVYESPGPGPARAQITEFGRQYVERAAAAVEAWEG